MDRSDRRKFLGQSTASLAGAAALSLSNTAKARAASDRVVVGLIGCGGRGSYLAKQFAQLKDDVSLAFVCDPDEGHVTKVATEIEQMTGARPKTANDMRRLLDEKAIDAVVVATPDHWHAPATILACDAGKHVYVEKPCSHNLREGRLAVEAARRNRRIVQHGTQSRSDALVLQAIELLRKGTIGDILVAKAWNVQRRANIGHAAASEPPAGFDYDLWLGPAPHVPFQTNRHHYTWHWWHDFGTGDMGNDGVHELDIARWGLGVETLPSRIAAIGGKYYFDDDQQFPDTQYVSFEYPGDGTFGQHRQLVFEQRIWSPYRLEGADNGNAFYGTEGWMLLSKRGILKLFGPRDKPIPIEEKPRPVSSHFQNFVDAIRGDAKPRADIEIGHRSAALPHLGNLAARLGRSLEFDPQQEQIVGDEEANQLLRRTYREGHWAVPQDA